jgi:hypothetical protein
MRSEAGGVSLMTATAVYAPERMTKALCCANAPRDSKRVHAANIFARWSHPCRPAVSPDGEAVTAQGICAAIVYVPERGERGGAGGGRSE